MTDTTTDTPIATPMPVWQALAAIAAELPNIGKDSRAAEGQGGYPYRGIEAITGHVAPLLSKYGVTIVPDATIVSWGPAPGMRDNWTDVCLSVRWTIYGPDGSKVKARTVGIGRDNADKGANKAMTQAYKYLLLDMFCISDAKDDSDGADYSGGERRDTRQAWRSPQEEVIRRTLGAMSRDEREAFTADFREHFDVTLTNLPVERHAEALAWTQDRLVPPAEAATPADAPSTDG